MALLKKGGKAYDSADVIIDMLGNTPNEVTEISYDLSTEHQHNHSLGSNEPTSWSMGNTTYNGSITMTLKELFRLERANGGIRIDKIRPFDIIVSYVNEFNEIVQDRVTAKFQDTGRNVTGDMGPSKQLTLFVLSIQ